MPDNSESPSRKNSADPQEVYGTHAQSVNRAFLGVQKENESKWSVAVASWFGAYRFSHNFMGYEEAESQNPEPAKRALGGVYSAIAAPFTMPFDLLATLFFYGPVWLSTSESSLPNISLWWTAIAFPNQAAVLVDFNETNSRLTKGPEEEGAARKPAKIIANIFSGAILGFLAYCPIHCLLSPETLPGFIKGMHWMRALNWLDTASVSLGPLGVVSPIQVILQVTTVIALVTAIERAASKKDKVDAGDIARIATALGMCVLPILVPALCHLDISGMPTHIAVALFFAMPIVNNVMQAFAGDARGEAADDLTQCAQLSNDGGDDPASDSSRDSSTSLTVDTYLPPAFKSDGFEEQYATSDDEDNPAASPGTGGGSCCTIL